MVFVTEGEAIVKAIVLLKIRYTTILKPFMMTKMKMNTRGGFNMDFQEITGTLYSVMNLSSQKYNIGHIPFQNALQILGMIFTKKDNIISLLTSDITLSEKEIVYYFKIRFYRINW